MGSMGFLKSFLKLLNRIYELHWEEWVGWAIENEPVNLVNLRIANLLAGNSDEDSQVKTILYFNTSELGREIGPVRPDFCIQVVMEGCRISNGELYSKQRGGEGLCRPVLQLKAGVQIEVMPIGQLLLIQIYLTEKKRKNNLGWAVPNSGLARLVQEDFNIVFKSWKTTNLQSKFSLFSAILLLSQVDCGGGKLILIGAHTLVRPAIPPANLAYLPFY